MKTACLKWLKQAETALQDCSRYATKWQCLFTYNCVTVFVLFNLFLFKMDRMVDQIFVFIYDILSALSIGILLRLSINQSITKDPPNLVGAYIPTLRNAGNKRGVIRKPCIHHQERPQLQADCISGWLHRQSGCRPRFVALLFRAPWYWQDERKQTEATRVLQFPRFQLILKIRSQHKVSWSHQRLKHWHQLYLILTRLSSLKNVRLPPLLLI